jgi:hypothetical protein
MLMEVVGNNYLACKKGKSNKISILESIQLSYMSQGKNTISFQTEIINDLAGNPDGNTISNDDNNISSPSSSSSITELNITAIHEAKKVIVSQGVLRYKRTI